MAFARIRSLARNLLRKTRVEQDLDAELRGYVDQLTEENLAAGMPGDRAAREARMAAETESVKEQVRSVRAGALLEQLAADLRFGARMLLKHRSFSAIAVLTLALGIGSATAMFSVVYGVLLRPLPYDRPGELLELREVGPAGQRMSFADPNFEDVRATARSLSGVAEYAWWQALVTGASEPTRSLVAHVSRDFFPLMHVQPALGRGFGADDARYGAERVALVSHAYWKQYLGGRPDLSSARLIVEDEPATIVGVLPAGFGFPGGTDIWLPREVLKRYPSRTAHNFHVIARLGQDASLPRARAELSAVAARLKRQYGRDTMMTDVAAIPLQEELTGRARPALLILLGAVGFLLLIAWANVVNLLLAQAPARERELALRSALGAGRGRLVRQFLTEALLLALSGGTLGVLAATWGVRALLAIAPRDLPRTQDVSVSLPVLSFALAVSALVAVGLGVFTALRATSSRDLQRPLSESGRGDAGGFRAQRVARTLLAAQLAITLVLLVGAGLLGRSLLRVLSIDPGFKTDHIVTMDLALHENAEGSSRRVQFVDELLSRLRRLPGVQEVGGTRALPLSGADVADGTYVLLNPQDPVPAKMEDLERLFHDSQRTGNADYRVASDGYFRALQIPLLRGRLFEAGDTVDSPHACVISDSLAREKWPGQDPLGHLIEFGNMDGDLRPLTVVGVVGDMRGGSLEVSPRPTIYVDYRQRPAWGTGFVVVVRADTDPAATIAAARAIARDLDPNVPPRFKTFSQVVSASLGSRRFNLTLIALFASSALLLALAGIYGVISYGVARRTREIGVRVALGAGAGSVLRLVLGSALKTAAVGVAIGIAGSLALTGTMKSLLFGVSPADPATIGGVVALLASVAALACYIPARRATRVQPTVALRCE